MSTDKVKQRIIELVPEIMELKFGCQMEHMPTGKIGTYLGLGSDQKVIAYAWGVKTIEDKFLKPLGRPIQLHHVLQAIAAMSLVETVTVDENGSFTTFLNGVANLHKDIPSFDFALDYDNQDQTTRDFIGRLLGVTT